MFNLVKAELFKYSKKPFIYKLNLIFILCIMAVPLSLYLFEAEGVYREYIINGLGMFFNTILILVMVFATVFLDDFRDGTYKNLVVSNLSKREIYLGKYICQVILACITMVICTIAVIIALTFIKSNGTMDGIINETVERFLCSIPMYFAGIALVDLLVIIIKRGAVYITYYLILSALPTIIGIAESIVWDKLSCIREVLMSSILSNIEVAGATSKHLFIAVASGIIYTVIFLVIGITVFSKQEIK
ncbi:MAG: ABC transporter permease [Clostridium sp.]|uniref:ABC transporter permease n=1 Tax=Clostridium sp. TaxID=1506 RepID=UPI003F2EE045